MVGSKKQQAEEAKAEDDRLDRVRNFNNTIEDFEEMSDSN